MIHTQQTLQRVSQTGVKKSNEPDEEVQDTAQLIPDDSLLNQQEIGGSNLTRATIRVQEGDHVSLRGARELETGRIQALTEEFVYLLMDHTNERRVFAAYADGKAKVDFIMGGNMIAAHTTSPFSEHLSERWLLERTYHAQLREGRELPVAMLTQAMQQLIDVALRSTQSVKSKLPETLPIKKSTGFFIPISTWREITKQEARITYQQGKPVLLYSEQTWEHTKKTTEAWGPNQNMRTLIFGTAEMPPAAPSGSSMALCYLDARQGSFSNGTWKSWFASDPVRLFGDTDQPITFFGPYIQYPFTTHYTVVASDGQISEYPDHIGALQGFATSPLQEEHNGNIVRIVVPHFSYYHDITCPSGVYRLEFFGSEVNKQGYTLTERSNALSS
jgi:hypothetical protein